MLRSTSTILVIPVLFFLFVSSAPAGQVTMPNTFQSGTPAMAAEVNANFAAAQTAVNDNDTRIAALESALAALQATVATQQTTIQTQAATIASLEADLNSVNNSEVMELESYIEVDATGDARGPLVRLSGVNLQLVNGQGSTETVNGLGNLIIGYDEDNTYTGVLACSDGARADETVCTATGATWGNNHKSGSHYLVLGSQNNYSSFGGLVAGYRNFATRQYSTVSGGTLNIARGSRSSVTAGIRNVAVGSYAFVAGGSENSATGLSATVTGGRENSAMHFYSSVSGGYNRSVGGEYDWRAGGLSQDE